MNKLLPDCWAKIPVIGHYEDWFIVEQRVAQNKTNSRRRARDSGLDKVEIAEAG